ncbi:MULTISPECIES: MFS transporter [Erwinia]|uniref:MFS transporter n=1 Tax=Erwinia TaxID=551 RepID=UPI00105C8C5F|nr:MFS transporter [Erwinia rhapontici]MBP2155159.1 putative MFS family arabinose efflux permease [Erwinia rhapontici]MCS3605495.1 putative MFS family arabinose efflux permease [Erwinia rhapontici]TDS99798.1 putative MFS family arabinose efflux permease [Erwinia rhapontici]
MSSSPSRLPVAVYTLGFGVFALVTSEFQVAALMNIMTTDLHITLPMTGYLITVYALAMAIGGPLLALLLLKHPPRRSLLILLTLFIASQALGAVAGSYLPLVIARILTGAVAGAYIGCAVSTGVKLVPEQQIPAAITVVLGGLMIGTVIGLPLASFIGNLAGWRVSFWSVVVITLLALWLTHKTLPSTLAPDDINLKEELRALKNPTLWRAYSTSLLIIGATFAGFSYFTPILSAQTGFSSGQVTGLLLVYGMATVLGNAVVGRLAGRYALPVIACGLLALVGFFALFASFIQLPSVAIACVVGVGLFGVTMNPAMVTRVMGAAGNRQLVNTLHTSMVTFGLMLGSLLGGLSIEYGFGLSAPLWIGAGMALCGLLTLLPDVKTSQPEACRE